MKPSICRTLAGICLCISSMHAQTTVNVFQATNSSAVQIFPSTRPMPWIRPPQPVPGVTAPIRVESVSVDAAIHGQHALTTLEIVIFNPNRQQQEAEIFVPVPRGSSLKSFDLDGVEGKLNGQLLPREEARRIYDSIVRRVEDPGLLEFAGDGLLRTSVFPVPANGKATVKMTYEQFLPRDGNRIDFLLPRSEALEYEIPWDFTLTWKSDEGLDGVFCPSHELESKVAADGTLSLHSSGKLQPGAIRISAMLQTDDSQPLHATVYTYPETKDEDGYFLMVIQAPSALPENPQPRDITFVFDRSGSMAGEKIEQTRAAAMQVLETLNPEDTFNFITYNESVRTLFPASAPATRAHLQAAREFIQATRVSGGTNIHDALVEALKSKPAAGAFPAILFLTDGIPTIGETGEKAILESIAKSNSAQHRIFSFGVGLDLNAPLLTRLSANHGGRESFVLPGDNIEVPVAGLARRLQGVLALDPELNFTTPARLDDILPRQLPDLFAGDQVLVLGRYRGAEPLAFELTTRPAHDSHAAWTIKAQLDPAKADLANAFVPRLWANRKIAVLTSALRDLGAASGELPTDPRTKELVEEIVRLSLAHGILTEYTAFLAVEGAALSAAAPSNTREASRRLEERAMRSRTGAEAINQELNLVQQRDSAVVMKNNQRLDGQLNMIAESRVQQIADKSFLLRNGTWQDTATTSDANAQDVIIGTPEFDALVDRLVTTNRQSILALPGEILIEDAGQLYRIRRSL